MKRKGTICTEQFLQNTTGAKMGARPFEPSNETIYNELFISLVSEKDFHERFWCDKDRYNRPFEAKLRNLSLIPSSFHSQFPAVIQLSTDQWSNDCGGRSHFPLSTLSTRCWRLCIPCLWSQECQCTYQRIQGQCNANVAMANHHNALFIRIAYIESAWPRTECFHELYDVVCWIGGDIFGDRIESHQWKSSGEMLHHRLLDLWIDFQNNFHWELVRDLSTEYWSSHHHAQSVEPNQYSDNCRSINIGWAKECFSVHWKAEVSILHAACTMYMLYRHLQTTSIK